MELTIFNRTNTAAYNVRLISVNKRTSIFGFSKRLLADFGWKEGTPIVFAQDKDNPTRWFIASPEDDVKDSFSLKTDYKGGLHIRARGLSLTVVNGYNDSKESVKFLVGIIPIDKEATVKFYPLIPIED